MSDPLPELEPTNESRATFRAFGGVLVLIAVAVLAIGAAAVGARSGSRETVDRLVECTTPSPKPPPPGGVTDTRDSEDIHECYEAGQARTAEAIARITDADADGVVDYAAVAAALIRIEEALRRLEAAHS